ncbi:O-antigen ligase family protein [Candidatus Saccharibacteria bacterium]|nr:O-antigen ligase family protein [Candidatus Saccharibacteria bacterium]
MKRCESKSGAIKGSVLTGDASGFGGWLERVYLWILGGLPVMLYFSYFPVISLGANEAMNFELSLPIIWLVGFDIVGVVLMCLRRRWGILKRRWYLLLFPVFASLSIIWSDNVLRGVLTVGMMWAVVIAMVVMMGLWGLVGEKVRRRIFGVFIGATVAMCLWCVTQCVMDVAGISREATLLCQGCTYRSFGFPHPNGFAIEPQFMGSLLIAPVMMVIWKLLEGGRRYYFGLIFVISGTLFLTFSRGAIYAFFVGVVFLSAMMVGKMWRERKCGVNRKVAKGICGRLAAVWGVVILAFCSVLLAQGVMAEVGPTSDTFSSGIAKAVNHLTLGVVDFREKNSDDGRTVLDGGQMTLGDGRTVLGDTGVVSGDGQALTSDNGVVEKPVENFEENRGEAVFDGYVVESTEVRQNLTRQALAVWGSNIKSVMIGVGIGGAGEALYRAGYYESPKEIVQNEYASLLLETGVVGVALLVVTMGVIVVWLLRKWGIAPVILATMVAYGVSLVFFSGLANALQVYLMPVVMMVILSGKSRLIRAD